MDCGQVYMIEDDATACQPGRAPIVTFQPRLAAVGELASPAGSARERDTNLGFFGTAAEAAQDPSTLVTCGDHETARECERGPGTEAQDAEDVDEGTERDGVTEARRVLKSMAPQHEHAVVKQLAAACRAWLAQGRTSAEDDDRLLKDLDSRLSTNGHSHTMQQPCCFNGPMGVCHASRFETCRKDDARDARSAGGKCSAVDEGPCDASHQELRVLNEAGGRSSEEVGRTMCTADMNMRLVLQYRRERKLLLQRVVEGLEVQASLIQPYV